MMMVPVEFILSLFTLYISIAICGSDFLNDLDDFDLGSLAKAFSPTCSYECKNGAKPRPNRLHTPSSNGCGSFGLQLDFGDELPQMTTCCDKHDICYDTCNSDRDTCDEDFHTCLKTLCDKHYSKKKRKQKEDCKKAVMVMYSSTTALGCSAYLQAQESACACDVTSGYTKQKRNGARTKHEL